ncbi:hypothetical protein, partial [Mesorhizobium sp.]|uniref:hypothetical protein n=1 Tax=Mesorhizobium sp. TaxID=1871066 RepID=UPI0025DE9C20
MASSIARGQDHCGESDRGEAPGFIERGPDRRAERQRREHCHADPGDDLAGVLSAGKVIAWIGMA